MDRSRFVRYAWGLLIYNLFVVMWGAYVRASVSGDGCGKHWPFCEVQMIPTVHRTATLIEFLHRLSSGLILPLALVLLVWAYRAYQPGHPARRGAVFTLFFVCTEGLLGAGLVLFGLVAHNDSVIRAFVMSAHLTNTFLLLASIALTAWWGAGGGSLRLRGQGAVGIGLAAALLAALVLGISGSVTALVDTLYPADNLIKALQQDIYPGVHTLIRLRLYHPIIAISVGIYSVLIARFALRLRPSEYTARFAGAVSALFLIEIAAGCLNLLLLAPIWMQLLHLLLADALWISLILLTAAALAKRVYPIEDN
jgi:protoheme IX farnesyltransferase